MKKVENKILLTLIERIILFNLLPQQGDFKSLIIVDDIRKKIGLNQLEIEKYEVKTEGKGVSWNEKGDKAKFDYEFTSLEKNEIKLCFEEINKSKKATIGMLPLLKKFNISIG